MTQQSGNNDGPLGKAPDISVGASDTVLLIVSFIGFCMLAWSIYSIVLAKLKTAKELEDEAKGREFSYDERLVDADVSTMNRAQRRARARHIMKQQRKLGGGSMAAVGIENADGALLLEQEPPDDDDDENIPEFRDNSHLQSGQQLRSRKERQKAAKQVELKQRKLHEEDRRQHQQKAQKAATEKRKEKERLKLILNQKQKKERLEQQKAEEMEAYRAWKIFLEKPGHKLGSKDDTALTVRNWIKELQQNNTVRLKDLADRFGLEESTVHDRIQELIDQSRISGILEKSKDSSNNNNHHHENSNDGDSPGSARFIYLSPQDMSELASFVKSRDRIATLDVARHLQEKFRA